ncbi:hypothetical protein [Limisphaera sp. 4302-co]|uniref:hypothetical protein n=1 Tax=Limisphaera sp. 4302-co TaxID=3400417 RepID=UPI003C17D0AE
MQLDTLIHGATYWFCGTFLDRRSRLVDQMVMAARSGRRSFAEGHCSEQFAGERLARRQTQTRRDSVDRPDPSDQHRLRPQTTEGGAGKKPPASGVPAPARGHETLTAQTDMSNLDT